MKKYSKFLVLILVIGFCVFFAFLKNERVIDGVTINDSEFSVEVVNNDFGRQKGLGGRDSLCDKCGMLFVFDEIGRHGFWMEDMKFDIDILWIMDGEIVYIEKNVLHETPEVIYKPEVESDMVLELGSGIVDDFRIKVGDNLSF